MAKQTGILPIKGTLGNITFYKSGDGYLIREKGGIDKKRIATDSAFERTRENNAEFGTAGKSGKLIRAAFQSLLQNASDGKVVSRLTGALRNVIKADQLNLRGKRNAHDGDVGFLEGFDFNVQGKLSATLFAPYSVNIDRVKGSLSIDIASFTPANTIFASGGATHFRIVSGGAQIDFLNSTFNSATMHTDLLPLDNKPTAAISLVNAVPQNSALPLFLVLGIEFFQQVNGEMYSLKSGGSNALSIIAVQRKPETVNPAKAA